MSNLTENNNQSEIADVRINAYIDMLKTVYQVDEFGLADMLGIHRGTWTKERKASFENKHWSFVVKLASVTGINLDWLVAFDCLSD